MNKKSFIIDLKKKKSKRIPEIEFTRACCCLGIVVFHYFCRAKGNFKFLIKTANSPFGFIYVTSFFNISGAVLYYNYPSIKSIKAFYFRRWKSIFPSFYICYFYFFLRNIFRYPKLIYKIYWPKLFFTFLGLDGFFLYKIKNYYLVGEWFLGAIIIIYFFYPILLRIISKNYGFVINIICFCFYFLMYKKNFFTISNEKNIITCFTSFYFGMNAIKYIKFIKDNKVVLVFAFFFFCILCTIKINSFIMIYQIQGFSFFIIFNSIGHYIMQSKFYKIFSEISNISFIIFLYHHPIIFDILKINTFNDWYFHVLSVLVVILITYIMSKIHIMVLNSIIKSNAFIKFESFFIE